MIHAQAHLRLLHGGAGAGPQGDGGASASLNRLHQRQSGSDRALQQGMKGMREICEKLNIPESIRDVAYRIFKEVSNMDTCRCSIVSRSLCCCIQDMFVCGPYMAVPLLCTMCL